MKFILLLLVTIQYSNADISFSADSALSYLKELSAEIGPRTIGSPNEQKALDYCIQKFHEFGLDTAYIMKMERAQSAFTINTNSGIAIGILKGKSERTIIIGGHLDSAAPDVPGAIDNASGTACVIELARILSREELESTVLFCLFGGEEYGTCGSNYFVTTYPNLDSCVLMIQLDMANGSELLMPVIDGKNGNTPIWLVQATYEEAAKLGYSNLKYLTHFFTFLSITPTGGVGSDHLPFLRNNIPAICLSSDLNDPFHTPQDNYENFKPSGLKRSSEIVYSLVHRFDKGVPSTGTQQYYLLQLGNYPFFISYWILYVFMVLSIVTTIIASYKVFKRRAKNAQNIRSRLITLKFLLIALIIQSFVWLSENLVALIKGLRYPWFAYPFGYFILGIIAGFIAIVIVLKFSRKMNLSTDSFHLFLRAIILLMIFTILLFLINVKLAFYPSFALLFLSLAMLANKAWLKIIFWLISPYLMIKLIFSEGYIFLSRTTVLYTNYPIWMSIFIHIIFIIFFSIWFLPFLFGFAAIQVDTQIDFLKLLRKKIATPISLLAFSICLTALIITPSYSDIWQKKIMVNEEINLDTNEGTISLQSSDYLKNVYIKNKELDTTISVWDNKLFLKSYKYERDPWIKIDRKIDTSGDSIKQYDITAFIKLKHRPFKFTLSYTSLDDTIKNVGGPFISRVSHKNIIMHWESFPDTLLVIPIHFTISGGSKIKETVEANFTQLIDTIYIKSELTNVSTNTKFTQSTIIN